MADRKAKSDDDYQAQKAKRNDAMRAELTLVEPRAAGGGAAVDAEIAALQARVSDLETNDAKQDQRLTALEAGGSTTPPVEPPIEPPIEPPVTGKRYPVKNDPSVGCPAGTSLTASGAMTISQAGAKVSGKKFSGRVTIAADNVELFNCTIDTGDWWAITVNGRNAVIHHCTVSSSATSGNSAINTNDGTNVHHCRFTGFENAFNIAGDDNLIEWNESWGLKGNSSSHYDNLQADGGFSRLKIRHNYLDCAYGQTSACMLDNYFGKLDDVEVSDNFLGGGGYTAYLDGSFKGSANATNIRYLNNDMRKGAWGYFYHDSVGTNYTRTGNKDYVTGASVDSK